ncbi:MAG: hypothetical protein JNK10_00775 [Cyclobacteriaceae bacterium]|nr:hypothetical protein [Cyclobacteriaceae bacterium]
MATHQEILVLKEELKKIQEQAKKSRTRGTIGMVLLIVVVILSLVYGFTQSVSAQLSRDEALKSRELAEASRLEAEKNAMEAQAAMARAEATAEELAECRHEKKK